MPYKKFIMTTNHESLHWTAHEEETNARMQHAMEEESKRKKQSSFRIQFKQTDEEYEDPKLKKLSKNNAEFRKNVEGIVMNQDGKEETHLFRFTYKIITSETGEEKQEKLPGYEDLGLKPEKSERTDRE